MRTVAILTAAGSGSRLGSVLPKALVELDGVALVAHAASRLCASGAVTSIVVTAPAGHIERVRALVAAVCTVPVTVVQGGASRQASVRAALAALDDGDDVVLVHDAARPLASGDLIARLLRAIEDGSDAVVPGIAVVDTIKEVDGGGGSGGPDVARAVATLPRARLRAIQTPQAFRADLLRRAHDHGADLAASELSAASDDAGLVEALGLTVQVIPGEDRAMKITTAHDLAVAELMLREGR